VKYSIVKNREARCNLQPENTLIVEEVEKINNYPLRRIMHIISLVLSAILVLVGIHIMMKEEEFEYELYFYWFIALFVMISMVMKMFMVVKTDLPAKKIILGFLVEFIFVLPIVLNDWTTHKQEFALAMFITNVARVTYYIFAVIKNSDLA